MFWIYFAVGLVIGSILGVAAYLNIGGIKGIITGIIITFAFGLLFGGGTYLEEKTKADNWNGGYCPDCNIHWIPCGASDKTLGGKHKYYYCENCYKEIEL